jgi:hypothetical protein
MKELGAQLVRKYDYGIITDNGKCLIEVCEGNLLQIFSEC